MESIRSAPQKMGEKLFFDARAQALLRKWLLAYSCGLFIELNSLTVPLVANFLSDLSNPLSWRFLNFKLLYKSFFEISEFFFTILTNFFLIVLAIIGCRLSLFVNFLSLRREMASERLNSFLDFLQRRSLTSLMS
eukprot:NODE_27_length_39007_cov_1.590650.p29 type:complete len:135 gc:universal NODE_27_length_39007_cov_1.590650:271-675(+)